MKEAMFFPPVCPIKTAIHFAPGSKNKALNVKPQCLLTLLTRMSKINDLIIPLTKGIRVGNLSSARFYPPLNLDYRYVTTVT